MEANMVAPVVNLNLTVEQAAAVSAALDLFVRVGIGQLEAVADLVRYEVLPVASFNNSKQKEREAASAKICNAVEETLMQAKGLLGYPRTGSHGIGHSHNHINIRRAYETNKALSKAIAEHRDPNPAFRGTNYDGLIVRYTTDPAPTASVTL